MSDAFWISFFGFAGIGVVQILLHIRAMAAQDANTRITVAAATGKDHVPIDSTQLEEVVKSVAADKKENKDVAKAVSDKVVDAAATVKKALNGELTSTINDVITQQVEPIKKTLDEMKNAFKLHQESDEVNMLEIRNSLIDANEVSKEATEQVIQVAAKEMATMSASQVAAKAREEGIKEGRRQVEVEMKRKA